MQFPSEHMIVIITSGTNATARSGIVTDTNFTMMVKPFSPNQTKVNQIQQKHNTSSSFEI